MRGECGKVCAFFPLALLCFLQNCYLALKCCGQGSHSCRHRAQSISEGGLEITDMLRRENGALLVYVVSSCTGGGGEKGHREKGQTGEDGWWDGSGDRFTEGRKQEEDQALGSHYVNEVGRTPELRRLQLSNRKMALNAKLPAFLPPLFQISSPLFLLQPHLIGLGYTWTAALLGFHRSA